MLWIFLYYAHFIVFHIVFLGMDLPPATSDILLSDWSFWLPLSALATSSSSDLPRMPECQKYLAMEVLPSFCWTERQSKTILTPSVLTGAGSHCRFTRPAFTFWFKIGWNADTYNKVAIISLSGKNCSGFLWKTLEMQMQMKHSFSPLWVSLLFPQSVITNHRWKIIFYSYSSHTVTYRYF